MATLQAIREELDKACILLQRQIPEFEIAVIAGEWAKSLQDIPDAVFRSAMQLHRQRSRYWPVEAALRPLAEEIEAELFRRRQSQQAALPEFLTPNDEQCAYNAAKARQMMQMLSAKSAVRQ